jgi:RNA polymerase sigma factor (sigma-70 family)
MVARSERPRKPILSREEVLLREIIHYLQRIVPSANQSGTSDAELLSRFAATGDESAFELLVWRHGRMVLGVCRRVLRDEQDAEDAFQAAFLVLARRARSISRHGSVGAWLYRVSYRAALAARARGRRRSTYSAAMPDDVEDANAVDPADVASGREISELLEQLIDKLPEKYRTPFVLCCLEGRSPREAARELGCPVGTLESWLSRARERLRAGLRRRQVAFSSPLLALPAKAFPSARVVAITARAARPFAASHTGVRGANQSPAERLADSLLRRTAMGKVKTMAALLLLAGLLVAGAAMAEPEPSKATPAPAAAEEVARLALVTGRALDSNRQPLAGARVWLRTWLKDGSVPPFKLRSTEADRDGRFRFADVDPGYASVSAVAPGQSYATVQRSVLAGPQLSDLTLVTRPAREARLRIVGDDDMPIHGVELTSLSWKESGPNWNWFPLDIFRQEKIPIPVTDRDGQLTIPGIPSGMELRLVFKHPDFALTVWQGSMAPDGARTVKLERGWPLTVEAVEAATGKPATRATVTITGDPGNVPATVQLVGEDGKFTARIAKASFIRIDVHHPELIAIKQDLINSWPDHGEGKTFHIELQRKGKVRGRVIEAKTGEPAPGARVELASGTRVVSDESGRYELDGPEGTVAVRMLYAPGFRSKDPEIVFVQVKAAAITEAPDFVVERLPVSRGTVVLPNGAPASQAMVTFDDPISNISVVTDRVGRFEFPIGGYAPYVVLSGHHLTEHLSGDQTLSFADIQAGKEFRLQLEPESELRGTFVRADNQPLAGVKVRLQSEKRIGDSTWYRFLDTGTTDDRGQFQFSGLNHFHRYRATVYDALMPERSFVSTPWIQPRAKPVVLDPIAALAGTPALPEEKRRDAADPRCAAWINSRPLTISSLRGKVVLLMFWATWNGPSLDEMPRFQRLHDLYADKGLVIIGIHHNSVPAERVRSFVRDRKLTFPVAVDDAEGASYAAYNITRLPTSVLIDRDGKIARSRLQGDLLNTIRSAVLYDKTVE